MTPDDSRHSRHHLFNGIGREGQRKIQEARVGIVGCGALGSRAAELLSRAGVARSERGVLRIIDRDYVDESNLQRQALFTTDDAMRSRPKAAAAATHVRAIDPQVNVEAHVRDLNGFNAASLLAGLDLIIDGSDNFRARFVTNDVALLLNVPWIYAGAVGGRGIVAMIHPPATPCLRCLLEQMPPLGAAETCDTAGIITPLPAMVVGLQITLALRLLATGELTSGITMFDAWNEPGVSRRLFQELASDPDCASCGTRRLPALSEDREETVTLCGRNSVQLHEANQADLHSIAQRLGSVGPVHRHEESVTATVGDFRLTVFSDGRVIVEGTTDAHEARTLAARFLA